MVRRWTLARLLLLLWLLAAAGWAQVETFSTGVSQRSDEASQLCARRLAQPLVQSEGFRRSLGSSELVQTIDCLSAVAATPAWPACERSLARIEVDSLVRFHT